MWLSQRRVWRLNEPTRVSEIKLDFPTEVARTGLWMTGLKNTASLGLSAPKCTLCTAKRRSTWQSSRTQSSAGAHPTPRRTSLNHQVSRVAAPTVLSLKRIADSPTLAAASAAGPSSGNAAVNHKFHFGSDDPDDDDEGEEEEEAEEEDQESVDDLLETAFQMLDIARTIYEKQDNPTDAIRQKLADVHRLLGDVATESGEPALGASVQRAGTRR